MTKKKDGLTLRPTGDRVLVLPDKNEESVTNSGLIVPTKDQNITGVVVGIGPGRTLDSGDFAEIGINFGERVLIGRYGHDEISFEGERYYLVPESSVLAIIE